MAKQRERQSSVERRMDAGHQWCSQEREDNAKGEADMEERAEKGYPLWRRENMIVELEVQTEVRRVCSRCLKDERGR